MHNWIFVVIAVFIIGCASHQDSGAELGKVIDATYNLKAHGEFERGYALQLKIKNLNPSATIQKIVYKKSFSENFKLEKSGSKTIVNTYIPISSRKVRGFRQNYIDQVDGILFEKDEKVYFYPVKFELKSK